MADVYRVPGRDEQLGLLRDMMINQTRGTPTGGYYEQFMQQQQKDELAQQEEARREEAQKSTEAYKQSLISESQQKQQLAQDKYNTLYGPGGLEQRKGESLIGLQGAETEHARAGVTQALAAAAASRAEAGLRTEQTSEAKSAFLTNGQIDQARQVSNLAIQHATMGNVVAKDEADQYEQAQQYLGHNKNYQIPRNPDGSWAYDPNTVAQGVMDPTTGMPSAKFAEDVRQADKPYTMPAQLVDDIHRGTRLGWTPDQMKPLTDKLREISAMTPQKIEGELMQHMLDLNDPEGALDIHDAFNTKPGAGKEQRPPTAEEIKNTRELTDMIALLDRAKNQLGAVTAQGTKPTGYFRVPFQKFLSSIEVQPGSNAALLQTLNMTKSEYIRIMHGRRAGASADLMRFIDGGTPNEKDSTDVVNAKINNMAQIMRTELAKDNGLYAYWGFRPLQGVPMIDPMTILKGGGTLPPLETPTSYLSPDQVATHVRAVDAMRRGLAAQNIGGTGAFRSAGPPAQAPGTVPPAVTSPSQGPMPPAAPPVSSASPSVLDVGKGAYKAGRNTERLKAKYSTMSDDQLAALLAKRRAK